MTKRISIILTSLLIFTLSQGLSTQRTRKSFLLQSTAALLSAVIPLTAQASPYCAAGVGENCQEISEGNEYIKALQRKSAENKEAYKKATTLAYQLKNYPDYFASLSPPKYMVMRKDGTFVVFTDQELQPLQQAGKIKMVQPMAFFGSTTTIRDMTQKPIMMLEE